MSSVEKLYLKLIPELQKLVISYGDPEINQRMKQICRQINYYKKEFTYQSTKNRHSIFFNKNEFYFPNYAFIKIYQKKDLFLL